MSLVALALSLQLDETYNANNSPGSTENTEDPQCELCCIVNSCELSEFSAPGSPLMRGKEFSDSVGKNF